MIKEIDELKRQYRRVEAQPSLLTRVRAEVAERPIQSRSWMPLTATLAVVVTAAWLLPVILQQKAPDPVMPSLSALAQLKPAKPAVSTPNLSALRSVSTPRMPAKPVVTPAPKPQTRQNTQDDEPKENHHA